MPSGWTTSGIDWTSPQTMRNSRTEDIVREIYLATHERDFWVQRWTQRYNTNYNTSFPNIEFTSRTRLENQVRFIYDTLRAWLTLDLTPSIAGLFVPNQAVWIDENQIPVGSDFTDTVNLGIPHWDMAQNGNLETELSVDLEFLRTTGNYRIRLDELFVVYRILNFLTKCRAYQIESNQDGTGFKNDLQLLGIVLTGNGVFMDRHNNGRISDPTTEQAYNDWASSTADPVTIPQLYNHGYAQTSGVESFLLSSTEAYYQFLFMTGYNNNSFNASDFDFNMIFYKAPSSSDPNPNLGLIDYINAVEAVQEQKGVKAFPFPNTAMQDFPPTYESWRTFGDLLPFANMNKEGFLKYYTEEAN